MIATPEFIEPNLERLRRICMEYVNFLEHKGYNPEDLRHEIFEVAMETVFGDDIIQWCNCYAPEADYEIPQIDATLCLGCDTAYFRKDKEGWACDHCDSIRYKDTKIPLRFPGDTDNAPTAE